MRYGVYAQHDSIFMNSLLLSILQRYAGAYQCAQHNANVTASNSGFDVNVMISEPQLQLSFSVSQVKREHTLTGEVSNLL